MLVRPLVGPLVGCHITSETDYVAIALRREGRGNQLMSKTGYVEIATGNGCLFLFYSNF
jgi:hypothetical protein